MLFALLVLSSLAWAKPAEDVRNELPGVSNVQVVTIKNTMSLNWQWQAPEELPVFTTFGYEIKRQDGQTVVVTKNSFEDANLAPQTYSYVVRARGVAKEKGHLVTYVSDWSELAGGAVQSTCPRPPTIDMTVAPTQKKYSSVPTMRFHMKGHVAVDSGCTLGAVSYHLDTGTGIAHTRPIPVDAHGNFDTFITAFGPEDEIPTGRVSFAISATAEDEAGPSTSNAYTLDVELENPFAPHD